MQLGQRYIWNLTGVEIKPQRIVCNSNQACLRKSQTKGLCGQLKETSPTSWKLGWLLCPTVHYFVYSALPGPASAYLKFSTCLSGRPKTCIERRSFKIQRTHGQLNRLCYHSPRHPQGLATHFCMTSFSGLCQKRQQKGKSRVDSYAKWKWRHSTQEWQSS